jgi:hypothetical protein
MTQKQTGQFCSYCQKHTLATGTKPNHTLHLILTILTGGLWGIVWILITLGKIGGYRCTQCGNKV